MDGKTFKGKTLQEGKMDTSSEKGLMQKMLEWVEVISEKEEEDVEKDKANCGQSELTQQDNNYMMTEGKVRLLLPNFMPQLKSAPRPWTFKRANVKDFFELGDMGSWEVTIGQNGPQRWEQLKSPQHASCLNATWTLLLTPTNTS
nr:hypothetical protein CFP56_49666 [Quercus suber]